MGAVVANQSVSRIARSAAPRPARCEAGAGRLFVAVQVAGLLAFPMDRRTSSTSATSLLLLTVLAMWLESPLLASMATVGIFAAAASVGD